MMAVLKYPNRNLALRHGARIIKRHDEPKAGAAVGREPEEQLLGYVEAVAKPAAIEAAVALFWIDDASRCGRLAVNPRR